MRMRSVGAARGFEQRKLRGRKVSVRTADGSIGIESHQMMIAPIATAYFVNR